MKNAFVADWLRQAANNCRKCRYFRSDGACVPWCPTMKYNDSSSICRPCHAYCHPEVGCTGPDTGVGPGRCIDCAFVKLDHDQNTVLECLSPNNGECEDGYYKRSHTSYTNRRSIVTMVLTSSYLKCQK